MSSATIAPDKIGHDEQRLNLTEIVWDSYVAIGDALSEQGNIRMIYVDGSLTFLTKSLRHDWFAERLCQLVVAIAREFDIRWETAGSATFRQQGQGVGVEGDATFYFGRNAEIMRGPTNIDLTIQPPPDLAIEVEITHLADASLKVWGRLGVPEVWRFDPDNWTFAFCIRQRDGSYLELPRGVGFPILEAADIISQMRLVEDLGADRWFDQLSVWVQTTLLPRTEGTV